MVKRKRVYGLRGMRRIVGVLWAAALLAGCTSTGSAGPSAASSAPAAAATASGGAKGFVPPKLAGATIRIAIGAAPSVTDTQVALIADILRSWGAKATVINQTGDPAAIRVILAGQADIGSIAVSTTINSGLVIFGPSQPRLDYHFMGAPGLKTMADLPGHIYGTSNVHGLEALMFADLLSKNHIKPDSVRVTIAGGAGVRVDAMLTKHIDATFVHFDSVKKLTDAGFSDLAKMSAATPELADSFMGGSPEWVKAHPDLAKAVDEAWIVAARIFNKDKNQWVGAAMKYAGGTNTEVGYTYDGFLQADTYPATKGAFSSANAKAQEDLAAQVGAITTNPPLSNWFTETAWDQAAAELSLP